MDATISREGTIEKLRVIDGPATLRQAALDAVAEARYRPFLLNGEPVEVQTSIRVIFSLGE
jgi:protein TonB